MKPLSIIIIICQLLLLGACSTPEVELELIKRPNIPKKLEHRDQITSKEEEITTSMTPETSIVLPPVVEPAPKEEITDVKPEEPQITIPEPEAPLQEPTLPSPETPQIPATLYLENGAGRAYYETLPYLTQKTEIPVNDGENDYGTVTYQHYKIIEDADGSGRQGIAFFYTETNISDEEIQVGLAGRVLNPLVNTSVFYADDELKLMPANEQNLQFADADYLQTQHVEFTQKQAKVESCANPTTLKPGKSRTCYNHYSYAGPGEYLINQAIDFTYSNYVSFLIEVK